MHHFVPLKFLYQVHVLPIQKLTKCFKLDYSIIPFTLEKKNLPCKKKITVMAFATITVKVYVYSSKTLLTKIMHKKPFLKYELINC